MVVVVHEYGPAWFAAAGFSVCILGFLWSSYFRASVAISGVLSSIAFAVTLALIPSTAEKLKERGLSGRDLNKLAPLEGKSRPEALGVVPGFVYFVAGTICYLGVVGDEASHLEYISGLLCVVIVTFLGFVDDVIELRWRYKVILPLFASLPLLVTYRGPTNIIVPSPIKHLVSWDPNGPLVVDLGPLYYVYMACLSVFCSNAINIHAGINGLEVGQSIIIAVAIIIHNTIEIYSSQEETISSNHHGMSLMLNLIFLQCSVALYLYNRFPSRVFVGDTYTYFAGVHFAVVGIMGHFAKTLLLLFLPQILNFVVSMPQLFGLVKCPRHRVPRLNAVTNRLEPTPNYTLINLTLRILGPMTEKALVTRILYFQVVCCAATLLLRYSPIYNSLFL